MNNLIKRVWTRKELVFVEDLRGMAFTQEDGAHTFSIAGKDENGADLALSGTVAGSLIRPDGTTTGMTGTIADGCANLTLSPECYGVSGRASLTIFLTSGGQKTAIYHAVMSIGKSSTSQVSPGVAADVVDLVNRIDTATASIPATYTALLGSIASDYDPSKTYKTGEHVWYGGYLYKAEQDIDTAESWTSGHWTKVVLADDFRSDITSLKSALGKHASSVELIGFVQKPDGINLIDVDQSHVVDGKYWDFPNRSLSDDSRYCTVFIDDIETDKSYSYLGFPEFYGTRAAMIPVFTNGTRDFISSKTGIIDSNTNIVSISGFNTIESKPKCTIAYSFKKADLHSFFVKGTKTTTDEILYSLLQRIKIHPFNLGSELAFISKMNDATSNIETFGIIQKPNGINLFNPYSSDNAANKMINAQGQLVDENNHITSELILLKNNTTYTEQVDLISYGTSIGSRAFVFNSDGSYQTYIQGTLSDNKLTFTTPSSGAIYTRLSVRKTELYNVMIVEGSTYPAETIKYYLDPRIIVEADSNVVNPLYGKKAIFMGDSICAATTVPQSDTQFYKWGWAGRIGTENRMTWKNYGVSGASITNMTGRSCIQNQLLTAYSENPDADYIIIEGGTNDADVIAQSEDYSIGTFSENDFTSTYDATTFCGAFETFLRNIITKYPRKKIGYIVAMKMGQYTESLARRKALFDIAKNICKKWGVSYIDLWEQNVMNPMIINYYDNSKTAAENIAEGKAYADGQHPTDVGYDLISPQIEKWMRTF